MSCSEDTIVLIPFQRILTKISHRLSQVRDVGGVSGNIGSVIGDIEKQNIAINKIAKMVNLILFLSICFSSLW